MNILVAVDLSEATPRVMQVTERVARQSEGKVRLLHVAEAEPEFMGYDAGPEVVRDQVAKEFRDEHKSIQAYAEQLREAGLDASARLIQGPIVETVFNEAKRFEADMLIVGSHGFGAIYDLLIGSISRGILKDTDIPVLVVPIRDPSLRP
ncbi:MAG: universal stress protein [Gammaproteobacteria bacterium]|nr:universal stress protein [Gammaproteobacteria bacterium]